MIVERVNFKLIVIKNYSFFKAIWFLAILQRVLFCSISFFIINVFHHYIFSCCAQSGFFLF